MLDNAGTLVVEYKYDAWGKLLSTTGTLADTLGKRNPFRYRGYVFDEETGLYYLRNRYYNPTKDRFLNADTNFSNGSLFAYCDGNPSVLYDPDGNLPRWLEKTFCAVGSGATMIGILGTHIVHQNTIRANIVSMEILDLEVVDLNWRLQLLMTDGFNEGIRATLKFQLVADLQLLRSHPAFTPDIEGMFGGTGNGFAIDLNVHQRIFLVQEGTDDSLQRPLI